MAQALDRSWREARINILKKVRIDGVWKLCPAVIEARGKLKDRVRVGGRVESHPEGSYYLDWRENGRRQREAIADRCDVCERARLKALEIEARRAGIAVAGQQDPPKTKPEGPAATPTASAPPAPASNVFHALGNIFAPALEQAVRSELERLSLNVGLPVLPEWNGNAHDRSAGQAAGQAAPLRTPPGTTPEDVDTIAKAIDTYLRDVEPPQREPKTYEEYKLVLEHFRLSCKKTRLKDIVRDDLKAFMRYLYAQGNEARICPGQ